MILRKLAITLVALQCLGITQGMAATPTAKPHPRVTSIAKVKKITHTTKKRTVAKKATSIKRKNSITRYIYQTRKPKLVQPSPSPSWPPKGFSSVGSIFARVPTGSELIGILSAMKNGAEKLSSCAVDPLNPSAPAYSCAALLVGSTGRCSWWKVTSTVTGIDPADPTARITLGDITVTEPGAAAKTIQTIFLVSPVPLQVGVRFSAIHALCGIGSSPDPVPTRIFIPAPSPTPSPSSS